MNTSRAVAVLEELATRAEALAEAKAVLVALLSAEQEKDAFIKILSDARKEVAEKQEQIKALDQVFQDKSKEISDKLSALQDIAAIRQRDLQSLMDSSDQKMQELKLSVLAAETAAKESIAQAQASANKEISMIRKVVETEAASLVKQTETAQAEFDKISSALLNKKNELRALLN